MSDTTTASTVRLVSGDIFLAPPNSILIHACNCVGSWGAGAALAFAQRYPAAFRAYVAHCRAHPPESLPGTALLIEGGGHWIGCLFTSERYGKRLDAPGKILYNTKLAVRHLVELVEKSGEGGENGRELHSVKINSGRFKVSWSETERVLEEELGGKLAGRGVTVYEFEEDRRVGK